MFFAAGSALLASATFAVPAGELKENYQPIIERNAFGLRPPVVAEPPVNKPPEAPKPKVDIFLTGITTIGYPRIPKQAHLMVREQGQKEPEYYSLHEEGGKDGITVLNIDEKARKVKIKTTDGELLLSFDTHGVPPPAAAPVAAVAGAPGQPNAIPAPPGTMPAPLNAGARPGRPPYNRGDASQTGNSANAAAYSQNQAQVRQIPSRTVRTSRGSYSSRQPGGSDGGQPGLSGQPVQDTPQIDPAIQYLNMRAQEQYNTSRGIPHPPTPPLP